MPSEITLRAGERFGRWTVIRRDGEVRPKRWICRCECGTENSVRQSKLRSNQSKSCQKCAAADVRAQNEMGLMIDGTWYTTTEAMEELGVSRSHVSKIRKKQRGICPCGKRLKSKTLCQACLDRRKRDREITGDRRR